MWLQRTHSDKPVPPALAAASVGHADDEAPTSVDISVVDLMQDTGVKAFRVANTPCATQITQSVQTRQ